MVKVRGYVRRIRGKPVRVRSHIRRIFTKRTTNRQYRNMDSDKDGVRNIDDCRPFDKNKQDVDTELAELGEEELLGQENVIVLIEVPTIRGLPQRYRIKGALASGPIATIEEFQRLYPNSIFRINKEQEW